MTIAPLTERILNRLGPPRILWVLLWAGLLGSAYAVARGASSPVYPGFEFSVLSVYVALLAMWGVRVITRRVNALQPDLERLLGRDEMDRIRPFARLNSIWGPLLFAFVLGSGWEFADLLRYPSVLNAVLLTLFILGWIPANAGLWVIVIILLDLHRLGRSPLRLAPFEEDATLGLRPFGSLAVAGFALVSVGMVPLLIVSAVDLSAFLAAPGQYVIITVLFVLSLWRLHSRLQKAKAEHLADARALCARVLREVRTALTQGDGGDQAAARLSAAEAIERRAAAIHKWPLGAGMFARVAAIFSAVVTAILARLILSAMGL